MIDLYTLFEVGGNLSPAYAQNDGVHLTGAAYAIWAKEINKKIREMGL
jgi:lysophospholipase L1-like esterase